MTTLELGTFVDERLGDNLLHKVKNTNRYSMESSQQNKLIRLKRFSQKKNFGESNTMSKSCQKPQKAQDMKVKDLISLSPTITDFNFSTLNFLRERLGDIYFKKSKIQIGTLWKALDKTD